MINLPKKMYVVQGYMNTGSASLTYPEDFDTVGIFLDREKAQAKCDEMNEEALDGCEDDDGNPAEDVDDVAYGEVMVWEVEEMEVFE